VGANALDAMTTGGENTAVGVNTLGGATTSLGNTAIGRSALANVTTGNNNAAIGHDAGVNITIGSNNTCLGLSAGDNIETGSNNVCLGNGSDAPATNSVNTITLGSGDINTLRCQVQTISSLSDARDKTNIVDIEDGLDLINLLKPRKFTWAMRKPSANDGTTHLGFIAQELDEVIGDKNDYMHLVDKINPDKLEAAYSRLIPILTKAIQELSAKVTALEAG